MNVAKPRERRTAVLARRAGAALAVGLVATSGVARAQAPSSVDVLRQLVVNQLTSKKAKAPTTGPSSPRPESQSVNVQDERITLHVDAVDIRVLLQLLSRKSRTNIVATSNVSGTVSANLYDVTLEQALDALLRANRLAYVREGDFLFVYTQEEMAEIATTKAPLVRRVYKPSYVRASELEKLLKPALSERGSLTVSTASQTGIPSNAEEAGGDDLATQDVMIICDDAEHVETIMALVKDVDVRPAQVMIEITMLTVQLDESNHLGVQFEALSGPDFEKLNAETSDLFTVKRDAITVGDGHLANIKTQGFASEKGAGLKIGYLKGNLHVFLEALESVGDTNVLASPKVVVVNKQRAEIVIGQRLGFRTRTATETSTVESIEFMDVGTQLRVRPWISPNGDIRMDIHPERSTGQINPDTELPEKSTAEVTTNVMVRDGQTVVIGGLMLHSSTTTESQVPGVGSLPIIGAAFQSKTDALVKTELIVLITPRLVRDEEAEKEAADALDYFQRRNRRMLGNMAFYGRHCLARTHFDLAEFSYKNEWDLLAQWYALWTLHFSPNHIGAHQLWDKVLERRQRREAEKLTRETIEGMILEDEG